VHKHGHGPATHHLALLCNQNGNINEFCKLLSLAADGGGNPDSLFLRGHCYYFGADGHTRDMSLAFADFIAAADGGNIDAMVSAGAMLHQGVRSDDGMTIIVNRDQQRGFELYQRAGELGSIEGWRNVVSCYATGEGVKKCLDTAKYIANTMLKDDRRLINSAKYISRLPLVISVEIFKVMLQLIHYLKLAVRSLTVY